jgi:hypothetical protein
MTMARLKLGKRRVDTDAPTHIKGTPQGNSTGHYESMPGHNPDGTSTAARSTGVNVPNEEPIDPRMPNLSPA